MDITIYGLICLKNNKIYIGQTECLNKRIKNHFYQLKSNKHTNPYLQQDFNKYGINEFKVVILENDVNSDLKLEKETFWMNCFGGTNNDTIYNVKGNGPLSDNKEYASRKIKGFEGKFDNFKNHRHTEESKQKISNSLKHSYIKREHKLAGACAGNNYGKDNAFYGKHYSNETKLLLSELRTKYDDSFIQFLRNLHFCDCLTFKQISLMLNMNSQSVSRLIKYGTTSIRKIKEIKNKECNDYPEKE